MKGRVKMDSDAFNRGVDEVLRFKPLTRSASDLLAAWADLATCHPLAVWCRWWVRYWD